MPRWQPYDRGAYVTAPLIEIGVGAGLSAGECQPRSQCTDRLVSVAVAAVHGQVAPWEADSIERLFHPGEAPLQFSAPGLTPS